MVWLADLFSSTSIPYQPKTSGCAALLSGYATLSVRNVYCEACSTEMFAFYISLLDGYEKHDV